MSVSAYLTKAPRLDPKAATFIFTAQKAMYGAKSIAAGDVIYLFDSENEGGVGLVARGVVTSAQPTPRMPGVARQTRGSASPSSARRSRGGVSGALS